MKNKNVVHVTGVKKSFGGVQALKGVDLTVKAGEIHCLAGENGSGKSTIIKIISGAYQPDEGRIEVNGEHYPVMTPSDSIEAGVQIIYQDFSIFPNLTVVENLALNKVLSENKKFVNKKEFREIAKAAISKINFNVDLDARVETLPVADKQLIAISRALLDDANIIIMDEPTTALTEKEVQRLFEIINDLKKRGIAILFVSHKVDEVFEISDSITIFRNGENVISCPMSEMTEEKFSYYMTGRKFDKMARQSAVESDEVILECDNLSAPGFQNVNFKLKKGEILGVTGLLGSGRRELSLALFGMLKKTGGKIILEGKEVEFQDSSDAEKKGMALVPEDRLTEGLFLTQSISNNITCTNLPQIASSAGVLSDKHLIDYSAEWVESMGVATDDQLLPVNTLSGGNQQKVVLARWLASQPKVLILVGPTVGVDIGAKYDIHTILCRLAESGMAIIVISDDAKEVMATCNRVLVMKNGEMTAELSGNEMSETILSQVIM